MASMKVRSVMWYVPGRSPHSSSPPRSDDSPQYPAPATIKRYGEWRRRAGKREIGDVGYSEKRRQRLLHFQPIRETTGIVAAKGQTDRKGK